MTPNIAVVGCGYWGKNLVRNFAELNALHTVCDGSPAVEANIRELYPHIAFSRNYADVTHDGNIDGVVLSTPAVFHFEMAKQALQADKDVFVEKPLALSVAEGDELLQLADQGHRKLMVGHILQ